jgi:hypothetical protein
MVQFSVQQYETLENSITHRRRVALFRRGTEYVVVPARLRTAAGREAVDATHPTTGDLMTFYLDELDGFEVIR